MAGISSACSRKGGTAIVSALSRKYKSERNRPERTHSSRSQFVEAMIRTSGLMSVVEPRGRNGLPSITRNSFAWQSSGNSAISSKSSVPSSACSNRPG